MANEKYDCMAKKQGGRLISSAGLVNYYDSDDRRAVHINPVAVVAVTAAIGIFILVLDLIY
jgi:preprotein translocase subunit Sec61beta